jgi:hypothetical protein
MIPWKKEYLLRNAIFTFCYFDTMDDEMMALEFIMKFNHFIFQLFSMFFIQKNREIWNNSFLIQTQRLKHNYLVKSGIATECKIS